MSDRNIVRWSTGGFAAMILAGVFAPSSALALMAHEQGTSDGYGKAMLVLVVGGGVLLLVGITLEVVAWAGALDQTRTANDSSWFTMLLWGGVFGLVTVPVFGVGLLLFAGLIAAFVLTRPDEIARSVAPSKRTVARWGGRGFAAVGGGALLALVVANMTNPGRPLHGVLWPSLMVESVGFTIAAGGAVAIGAAWWGALLNSHHLVDQSWFNRLRRDGIIAALTLPLLGVGVWIIAYVLNTYRRSAPDALDDDTPRARPHRASRRQLATSGGGRATPA